MQKKYRPSLHDLTHTYIVQLKYDGCCMVAIKEHVAPEGATVDEIRNTVKLYSRTGQEVLSADHIRYAIAVHPFMPVGVYFGEYWHPDKPQEITSGCFRDTKQQHDDMKYVLFDYVTLEEYRAGKSDCTYIERVARLPQLLFNTDSERSPVFPAEAQGLLVDLDYSPEEAAEAIASDGPYDGIILRNPVGKWVLGSNGTTGEIIKVKPTITLDLRVVQVKEAVGEKTGRTVYTVVVRLPNGNEQEVGSGVPHFIDDVPGVGQIVEVEAMTYSKNGLLREPRYKGIRYDKLKADGEE